MRGERVQTVPTRQALGRLMLAADGVAETLVARLADADLEGRLSIKLSTDEALAIATDAYETANLARWAWEQLGKGKP